MRALQGAVAALPGPPVDHRGSVTVLECSPDALCKMPPPSPGPFPWAPCSSGGANFLRAFYL